MRSFEPRPYQPIMRDHILDNMRCALFVPMGAGKTSATLLAITCLMFAEHLKVLIVAPVRVARDTWPEEIARWADFAHLRVSVVVGSAAERAAALNRDADIYTTNFEVLPWLVDHLGGSWPFNMVVVDEASKLKGFRLKQGTQRARALARVAHKYVQRMVLLSGTPAPNGLQDLWALGWFIDGGQRLGRTFSGFVGRWFQSISHGQGYTQLRPFDHAQDEIQQRLRDVCLSLNMRDWFDIQEPIRNVIRVQLPQKARALYRDMEREMFALIQGHDVEAFSAAARTIKCLQLASGAAYVGENNEQFIEVHDAKLQALESIVEEAAGMPVLLAYHFRSDLARILKTFPTAVNLATADDLAKFKAGEALIGCAHPASLGHGVDGLQRVTNIVAFYSQWWNGEEHDQLIERIGPVRQAQAGFTRPVFVHYLVAAETVDELVVERRNSKRAVQDILIEYMKARAC